MTPTQAHAGSLVLHWMKASFAANSPEYEVPSLMGVGGIDTELAFVIML